MRCSSSLVFFVLIIAQLMACGSSAPDPQPGIAGSPVPTTEGGQDVLSETPAEQIEPPPQANVPVQEGRPIQGANEPAQADRGDSLVANLATYDSARHLEDVLTPLALTRVPRAARRAALQVARAQFERAGRVVGALPDETILVALPMESEFTREQLDEGAQEDPCGLNEIAAIRGEEVVGTVQGVCADGEKGEVLSGDLDGDDIPELIFRTNYLLYTDEMSRVGAGSLVGNSVNVRIVDASFTERASLYPLVQEDDTGASGFTIAERTALVDMNGDGHVDLLNHRREVEGCSNINLFGSDGQPVPDEYCEFGEPIERFEVWLMNPETRVWVRPSAVRASTGQ